MRIGKASLSSASITLLAIQLLLVCSIAGKYLFQRWRCPRVWARTVAIDPELPMRGRYLSLRVEVDGCASTLPSARQATFPRDITGAAAPGPYRLRPLQPPVQFQADLKIENNKLLAVRLQDGADTSAGQTVQAWPGQPCNQMALAKPVDFYLAEHAQSPLPLRAGQELWIEVTLPPKGPPRPTQLALKQDGGWTPLAFQ